MRLSRKIEEQLADSEAAAPEVEPAIAFQMAIRAYPHGLARLLCWAGFHDTGAVCHTVDGTVHVVTYCDRCGRVVSVVHLPEDE